MVLLFIIANRYWAVTDIDYAHQRTSKRIGIMIFVIWLLSFLVSIAPLLGWKDPEWNDRIVKDMECIVSQDIGYQIFATASSFYVPLLVILFLYWRIFLTARKRIRKRQQVRIKIIIYTSINAFPTISIIQSVGRIFLHTHIPSPLYDDLYLSFASNIQRIVDRF